jgi:hypothetical protein
LCQLGIVGSYKCLTPMDRSKGYWGRDWLAARWRIVPPDALVQSYVDKGIAPQMLPAPKGSKAKQHDGD